MALKSSTAHGSWLLHLPYKLIFHINLSQSKVLLYVSKVSIVTFQKNNVKDQKTRTIISRPLKWASLASSDFLDRYILYIYLLYFVYQGMEVILGLQAVPTQDQ
jgi:hypothetical protein